MKMTSDTDPGSHMHTNIHVHLHTHTHTNQPTKGTGKLLSVDRKLRRVIDVLYVVK